MAMKQTSFDELFAIELINRLITFYAPQLHY